MAWVRFPDGSRKKVERVDKVNADEDLEEMLAQRAALGRPLLDTSARFRSTRSSTLGSLTGARPV